MKLLKIIMILLLILTIQLSASGLEKLTKNDLENLSKPELINLVLEYQAYLIRATNNTDIAVNELKKQFVPKHGIGLSILGGLLYAENQQFKLDKNLLVELEYNRFFWKYFAVSLSAYFQIYPEMGGGVGVGLKVIY